MTRFRLLLAAFCLPLAAVGARVATIQVGYRDAVLAGADRLTPRDEPVPAADGRVLTADGAVWAWDEARFEARVHYRHLQTPPDADWLRGEVRARLPGPTAATPPPRPPRRPPCWRSGTRSACGSPRRAG